MSKFCLSKPPALLIYRSNLGGTILEGSDTTSASIQNVIVCAVAFPEKQKLVSEELERVIGPHRVPRLEDLDNLPYTRAFINEVGGEGRALWKV